MGDLVQRGECDDNSLDIYGIVEHECTERLQHKLPMRQEVLGGKVNETATE